MRLARNVGLGALILVALALGGLHLATRLLVARAERAHPPVGAFVEVEGLRLHYAERGQGEAAVVFLHGNPGFLQDFDAVLTLAEEAGLRAIAFDRPGHGFSQRPAGEVGAGEQARLLRAALARLGVTRPVLVAHSWSGALALAYALDYPGEVRGLVLLAPVAYGAQGFGSELDRLAGVPWLGRLLAWTAVTPLAGSSVPPMLRAAFAPDPVPEGYAEAARVLWVRPGQFLAHAGDMAGLQATLERMAPRYPSIAVPVTIVLGGADRLVPNVLHGGPLATAIPGARLTIVPGLGHEIPQLRPNVVMQAVSGLLAADVAN